MWEKELEVAVAAARAAAEVIRPYCDTELAVERKHDDSPVTVADRAAEERVVDVLLTAFPTYGILGEEFGERGGSGARWIIDPIDGTKSFIRRMPFFATLIGLEVEGEIVVGVLNEPTSGDLYYASRGCGAFGPRGRLHVSGRASMGEAMMMIGGLAAWRRTGRWEALARLAMAAGRQRAFGDYLGHLFVARGFGEGMVELDLKPWDMAAIKILVEEAGGRFTDLTGKATIYGRAGLSTNGLLHDEILALINS